MLNDPSVTLGARVGSVAFVDRYSTYKNTGVGGLMYIKDDMLYYELDCIGRLCCLSYRKAYKVADITRVEVIENQVVRVRLNFLLLNPGLKITVKSQSGSVSTIIVVMPDAAEFAAKLSQMTSLTLASEKVM